MVAVVVMLGQLLGLEETLTDLSKHLVTGANKVARGLPVAGSTGKIGGGGRS